MSFIYDLDYLISVICFRNIPMFLVLVFSYNPQIPYRKLNDCNTTASKGISDSDEPSKLKNANSLCPQVQVLVLHQDSPS